MFCFVFNGASMDKLAFISLFMSYRINNTFQLFCLNNISHWDNKAYFISYHIVVYQLCKSLKSSIFYYDIMYMFYRVAVKELIISHN